LIGPLQPHISFIGRKETFCLYLTLFVIVFLCLFVHRPGFFESAGLIQVGFFRSSCSCGNVCLISCLFCFLKSPSYLGFLENKREVSRRFACISFIRVVREGSPWPM